jgi:hypothetical protein
MSIIILRTVKGSPITAAEADANFNNLNVDKIERVVSVNDANPAIRITQVGTGHVFLAEDSTNPDATPFVIRNDGKVGIGTLSPTVALEVTSDIKVSVLNIGTGAGNIATNTAVGRTALSVNTTGNNNTAFGSDSLKANQSGNQNTAVGSRAMIAVSIGSNNTAIGKDSMLVATTSADNTAVGYQTLLALTSGSGNTAIGVGSLRAATTVSDTLAIGKNALAAMTTGTANTAVGVGSLASVVTGSSNTALGNAAGAITTGSGNTLLGASSGSLLTTGTKNTFIGAYSGNQNSLNLIAASNNIVISDGDGVPRIYVNTTGDYLLNSVTSNNYKLQLVGNGSLLSLRSSTNSNELRVNTEAGLVAINAFSDAGTGALAIRREGTDVIRLTPNNNVLIGETLEST